MKDQEIRDMMRDIDPQFQQKADARAAAAANSARRSKLPAFLLGGTAVGFAALAAVILLPKLKTEQLTNPATMQESDIESQIEEITEPETENPIADSSLEEIRVMSPAYAPYIAEVREDERDALEAALMASFWKPYDMEEPFADGEAYSVFVYNNGDPYRITAYADCTVILEKDGEETRWQISNQANTAIAVAANSDFESDSRECRLTWCDIDSLNAKDVWKNTRVGAKECDMTSKQDIFYKMNNTPDYFDCCSGTVKTGNQFDMKRYYFAVDLNNASEYQYEENFTGPSAEALMNNGDGVQDSHIVYASQAVGPDFFSIDVNNQSYMKFSSVLHRIDSPSIPFEKLHSTDPDSDSYDFWNRRQQLLGGIAIDCIENYRMAIELLHDFDKWEITGKDQVNGRVCVQLDGTVDYEYEAIRRFVLFVDEATGVTVRMLGYDENDVLIFFIDVTDLAFDDEADPVRFMDLSGFTELKNPEPAIADESGDMPVANEPVIDPPEEALPDENAQPAQEEPAEVSEP